MIENEKRVSSSSQVLEARIELREHLMLEAVLMDKIGTLPEENFCRDPREAFARGAGYAYLGVLHGGTSDGDRHVFSAFFDQQPQNKYLDEMTVRRNQNALIKAALDQFDSEEPMFIEDSVDPYKVEELMAFIEGYEITRDYFAATGTVSSESVAELA